MVETLLSPLVRSYRAFGWRWNSLKCPPWGDAAAGDRGLKPEGMHQSGPGGAGISCI